MRNILGNTFPGSACEGSEDRTRCRSAEVVEAAVIGAVVAVSGAETEVGAVEGVVASSEILVLRRKYSVCLSTMSGGLRMVD